MKNIILNNDAGREINFEYVHTFSSNDNNEEFERSDPNDINNLVDVDIDATEFL